MNSYTLTHLADQVLLRDLSTIVARDSTNTAVLLAHIAEVDARKLYVPAAHPCMLSYCVYVLRLSEDMALKRIRAGRVAREFPAIFTAVAEGTISLSTVLLLKRHLTTGNADELLAAAAHRTRSEVELLLAHRFPQADVPTRVAALSSAVEPTLLTESVAPGPPDVGRGLVAPGPLEVHSKVTPLSPQRFAMQFTVGQETHDRLRRAQALLGHQVPSGDVGQVFDRALIELLAKLEKTKFAATKRPRKDRQRAGQRESTNARHVPAHVKNAVWERDGGRCTFVSEAGERCPARAMLEFDHIDEVARGGKATISSIRILCRVHNQYEAEQTYGTEFMNQKREEARRVAAAARAAADVTVAEPVAATEERAKAAGATTERATVAREAAAAG